MLEGFLHYLQYEKRFSPYTVISYKTDLEQFSEYLALQYGITEIADASHQMIRSWFVSLMEQHITPRSVNRKKAALNSFFKYLNKHGLLTENPMNKVLSPKSVKRLPAFVEEEKMKTLLDEYIPQQDNSFITLRDQLIIEMLYNTGMRLSELVNLKTADVNGFSMTIKEIGRAHV